MTRWQQLYLEDQRVLSAPVSACAHYALEYFRGAGKSHLLDLGCGVGRDSALLVNGGLKVTGSDAAFSGLRLAQRHNATLVTPPPLAQADARHLPFGDEAFEGIYCFGMLHEFVGENAKEDVARVMQEIRRVLQPGGCLVLATLAGDPAQGLPHLQMFTEPMFDEATRLLACVDKGLYDDVGCTGCHGYRVWRGTFVKTG